MRRAGARLRCEQGERIPTRFFQYAVFPDVRLPPQSDDAEVKKYACAVESHCTRISCLIPVGGGLSARGSPHRGFFVRRYDRSDSVRGASDAVVGSFEPRPIVRALVWAENTGDEHRQDAGQKDAVEGSGPADRSDRCAEPLHPVQVE